VALTDPAANGIFVKQQTAMSIPGTPLRRPGPQIPATACLANCDGVLTFRVVRGLAVKSPPIITVVRKVMKYDREKRCCRTVSLLLRYRRSSSTAL
jgi:hypothetical protein